MKSWKFRILLPVILISILIGTKFVLWDYPVSSGKRVGNLTKFSKKGKFIPTWEGTIDEGSGDKLTSYFSVSDDDLGQELYNYEGKQVVLYYNQYILGWPRDTSYDVISWKPKDKSINNEFVEDGVKPLVSMLSKTLFCSLLGTLYKDQSLYKQVKNYVKANNLYLYNQIAKCNE